MPPELSKYLRDMLDAVIAIQESTRDQTLAGYLAVRSLRDAAQWNFCVIGEALTQLKKMDPATAARITDHAKIIGLRNQLIHGYGIIDSRIVWSIIADKLPLLRKELETLLSE